VLFPSCVVNYYSLLVPTNVHIMLIYFTLSGCYMFRLVAIVRELATEYLLKASGLFTYHQVQHSKILHGARFALSDL
jgi:hypothetical protein